MKPYDPQLRVKLYPKPKSFVPVPDFPKGHRYEGRRRCQKWSSRNNRQCLGQAMVGKECCYTHGGATPAGMASATWKHGGYSKYLPTRMVEHYSNATKDPELLSLVAEISVCKARIYDLLTRVDTGESGFYWKQAQVAHSELVRALQKKDNEAVGDSLAALNRILARGVSDYSAWNKIRMEMLTLQKLEESERRRRVEMQTMIHSEQVLNLFRAMTDAAHQTITDKNELSKLANRFLQIATQTGMIGNNHNKG